MALPLPTKLHNRENPDHQIKSNKLTVLRINLKSFCNFQPMKYGQYESISNMAYMLIRIFFCLYSERTAKERQEMERDRDNDTQQRHCWVEWATAARTI